jgi:hypothetical protein
LKSLLDFLPQVSLRQGHFFPIFSDFRFLIILRIPILISFWIRPFVYWLDDFHRKLYGFGDLLIGVVLVVWDVKILFWFGFIGELSKFSDLCRELIASSSGQSIIFIETLHFLKELSIFSFEELFWWDLEFLELDSELFFYIENEDFEDKLFLGLNFGEGVYWLVVKLDFFEEILNCVEEDHKLFW